MNERIKTFEEKMKKTIGNLDGELSAIRAGRANPNVLNKIVVDYYGTPTPIQQVANVSVPEAVSYTHLDVYKRQKEGLFHYRNLRR